MDDDEVPSPCVQICKMDTSHLCVGCKRTIDEIAGWMQMDNAARLQVLIDIKARRSSA